MNNFDTWSLFNQQLLMTLYPQFGQLPIDQALNQSVLAQQLMQIPNNLSMGSLNFPQMYPSPFLPTPMIPVPLMGLRIPTPPSLRAHPYRVEGIVKDRKTISAKPIRLKKPQSASEPTKKQDNEKPVPKDDKTEQPTSEPKVREDEEEEDHINVET